MEDTKRRNPILTIYLYSTLLINILLVIGGFAVLFTVSAPCGIYAASICSISALFNSIGLTQLLRWRSTGLFFIVVSSFLSVVGLSIVCESWLTFYFGGIGIFVPYIIVSVYMACLIFLLFFKNKGERAWQQMSLGFDYVHFRHIYQLSSVIIAAIITIAIVEISNQTNTIIDTDDDICQIIKNVPVERLNATDVTIEEIVSFEKQYNASIVVNNRDQNITKRIFALKHLLLSGLMPEIHNRENLVNICMVHAGEFSPEQQEILDWYLAQDISIQDEWNVCEKATSIKDFKSKIEKRIKNGL